MRPFEFFFFFVCVCVCAFFCVCVCLCVCVGCCLVEGLAAVFVSLHRVASERLPLDAARRDVSAADQ